MSEAEALVGLRFHVVHAAGQSEDLVVDAGRALVGSAAHCEVRLSPESASPEHVEVFANEGRVHVATRAIDSPPTCDGAPCVEGEWPRDAVLSIGGSRLTVAIVALGETRRRRSPLWMLSALPVAAVMTAAAYARAPAATEPAIPEAAALFEVPPSTCPMAPGPELAAFAAEKERVALAKRERGPFSPRDAVEAVPLFELAATCFRLAGSSEAHDADAAAAALRARLEEEYHVRRVRLEHAYHVGDPFGAKRELARLLPMTADRGGPYVDWLASLDRYATLEIERRGTRGLTP